MDDAVQQFIHNFESEYKTRIISHNIENNVVKPGDNHFSGVMRLKFKYEKDRKVIESAVILKIPSLSSWPYDFLKQTNIFEREIYFYEKLLPILYQLQSTYEPFAPKLYAKTEAAALVLEDLTQDGYKPGDKIKQFDLDQSFKSLEMLANYHALGYTYLQILRNTDPKKSLIEPFQRTLILPPSTDEFRNFCKWVKPSLSDSLYQKIVNSENVIQTDPMNYPNPNPNSMAVIIHADFRTNNIMFKYDGEGKVSKVKIIDWQLSREGSPVIDLMFLFVTSVPIDIFKVKVDNFLDSYLKALNNKLSSLNNNRSYSRPELDADMAHYKDYYLRLICIIWQILVRPVEPGAEKDPYVTNSVKWLKYLERNKII